MISIVVSGQLVIKKAFLSSNKRKFLSIQCGFKSVSYFLTKAHLVRRKHLKHLFPRKLEMFMCNSLQESFLLRELAAAKVILNNKAPSEGAILVILLGRSAMRVEVFWGGNQQSTFETTLPFIVSLCRQRLVPSLAPKALLLSY